MVLNQEQFDAFRMEIATFGNIPGKSTQSSPLNSQ